MKQWSRMFEPGHRVIIFAMWSALIISIIWLANSQMMLTDAIGEILNSNGRKIHFVNVPVDTDSSGVSNVN